MLSLLTFSPSPVESLGRDGREELRKTTEKACSGLEKVATLLEFYFYSLLSDLLGTIVP